MTQRSEKQVKIYAASKILQQKVGKGPLDPFLIQKAEKVIKENKVDFMPLGLGFLEKLKQASKKAAENSTAQNLKKHQDLMTESVMELKANASMFHYPLIGELTNIMLSFLESIKTLDKDAIDIVGAHHDTLHAIITKKMSGDSGLTAGQPFISELKDACARYFKKRQTAK